MLNLRVYRHAHFFYLSKKSCSRIVESLLEGGKDDSAPPLSHGW
jgi:hypothetical protein